MASGASVGRKRRCALIVSVLASALVHCSVYDASLLEGSEAMLDQGGSDAADGGDPGETAGAMAAAGAAGLPSSGGAEPMGDGGGSGAGVGGATPGSGGTSGTSGASGNAGLSGAGGTPAGTSGAGGSGAVLQELSRAKAATASSSETANVPSRANDGNTSTRWCASTPTFPQWWMVDLGSSHALSELTVQAEHPERTYTITVESSHDGKVFIEQARFKGTGAQQTVSLAKGAAGRYVRITTLTGISPDPKADVWASFLEFAITGS